MLKSIDLCGIWEYRVGTGSFAPREVPFSALAVGRSEVRRRFDVPAGHSRIFLKFEGVTYHGEVTLNGHRLGEMLAYAPYRFEITDIVRPKNNELSVIIEDIHVPFGPSEGWENYGGIIRPVSLELTGDTVIENTCWATGFNDAFDCAECTVSADVNGPDAQVKYVLKDASGKVCHESDAQNGAEIRFTIDSPVLWSPDMPYLYTLETTAIVDGEITDVRIEKVGFKDFRAVGRRFHLNGKPLFLVGVCRHDLYGDDGHTASCSRMRRDMELIKSAGVNFVRLVHYPHDPRIIEIADEIGLLVSEEPGLWWSDMHNKAICDGSLEVLRRTVLRDRNHASIAFWLSFNECIFTTEYLMDAARVCREADRHHMVSGANCMSIEMTKELFPKGGMDFFTMHPYAPTPDLMREHAEALGTLDRPLMFTEWGGYFVDDNPALLTRFIRFIKECWQNEGDKPIVAGACLWMWAEMFEFTRAEPACADGILHESLVDRYGTPKANFEVFKREFARINDAPELEYTEEKAGILIDAGESTHVDLSAAIYCKGYGDEWAAMLDNSSKPIEKFTSKFKRERQIVYGPILQRDTGMLAGLHTKLELKPLVIPFGKSVTIPVNASAKSVYFFGNVSMPNAWPICGEYGTEIGGYTIRYADGTSQKRVLKNGEDITTATGVFGPSRIDPIAANAPRVLKFSYDYDREQYFINLLKVPTSSDSEISSISVWTTEDDYCLLLYGITLA